MCKCTHVRTHTWAHTFSLPLLLSLQWDGSLFTFFFIFIGSFHLPLLSLCLSLPQLRIIPHSVQPLLISPHSVFLCSFSLPSLPVILHFSIFFYFFFCILLSEESISSPDFSSTAPLPSWPHSLLSLFSLGRLSWSERKLNSTNTLGADGRLSPA